MKPKKFVLALAIMVVIGLTTYCLAKYLIDRWGDLIVSDTQSHVIQEDNSLWQLEMSRIGDADDIRGVYFYDETLGYAVASTNIVLKTMDGGKTWENVSILPDVAVDDILVAAPTDVFCVTNSLLASPDADSQSHIMKSVDGGHTWISVYSSNWSRLKKLHFDSNGVGVAVGRTKVTFPQVDSANLALVTNDHGQTWLDVSDALNRRAVKSNGRIEDYLTAVIDSKEQGIVVLSISGRLYRSSDEGETWEIVSRGFYEAPQTGFLHMGILKDGRFWVAGGASSQEGTWGVVAIMGKHIGWDRYRLKNYYFSDVESISDNEMIACGSAVQINQADIDQPDTGVILHSEDGGKSWTVIYNSTSSKEFTSIAKLSTHKFFVVGQNAAGIILERKEP